MFRNYLLRGHTKLIEEGVMPNLLHVVPVGDDTVLNGVLELEDASLGLGLVSHVDLLLAHAGHYSVVLGPPNNRGEDGPRRVVSGEPGLAHAGAVINHKGLNIVVTHLDWLSFLE